MNLVTFAMWILVGLLAGLLAGPVLKRGGYGWQGDISLGLVGSIVGSLIFRALAVPPEAGIILVAVVGFVGAIVPIVAQRKIWPAIA